MSNSALETSARGAWSTNIWTGRRRRLSGGLSTRDHAFKHFSDGMKFGGVDERIDAVV